MRLSNAALSRRFLWAGVLLLAAGCETQSNRPVVQQLCEQAYTPISSIQGSQAQSGMLNEWVMVNGVVTHVEPDGFFLQSALPDSDDDDSTSEALWVVSTDNLQPGAVLGISGQVAELESSQQQQTVTALIDVVWEQCREVTELPQQSITHLNNIEALENMRLAIPVGWQAMDLYPLRDQRLRIASERLFIPTQVVSPGEPANQLAERNRQRSVTIDWSGSGSSLRSRLRAGDHLEPVNGVFDLRQQRPVVLAEFAPQVSHAAKVPPVPEREADQHLRVVGMNLENLFNGDGQGGGFPTQRGAETEAEYQLQLDRIVAAVHALAPDILAVMELENDGYSATSAIAQLSAALSRPEDQTWDYIRPAGERLGGDVIAVGLLYRSDRVTPGGPSASISERPFDDLSRAPLAQRFAALDSDTGLLVSVNHFKSKGSCPDGNGRNSNQRDGQGCWSEARERSSLVLSQWIKRLQQEWNEPNALIIGDLNSYRMEDPIRVLIREGWTDVAGQFVEPPQYSYRFFGEIGTLDYAFANQALMQQVDNAAIWHVNSDTAPHAAVPATSTGIARFSDHDPVIVDISLQ